MTKARRLVCIAFALLLATSIATAQELSLAEQAAAARSARTTSAAIAPTVMGHTVSADYYNEVLGFQIRHFRGWTSMSRGTMNVSEAIGRDALGLQAGVTQAGNRAFGMHDELGSNVMVAIEPAPAGTTLDATVLKTEVAKALKTQLPGYKVAEEPLLLGDSSHRFVGLRGTFPVANRELYQSLQIVLVNGYAVTITTTTVSAEQLESLLTQLRASLQWTQPSAQ